ncbi:hypothetical protein [Halorubrum sp. PV6]|uniref:hypothetical protein n=1 Tax=Halorubrum sp. PV6 TaxID=634157 RepID=UPI000F853FDE|nr:hypothetical protein [Halorubrum sp. PV6]AZQ13869.1 hypothetical protein DOS48_02985 [Halorubrum sp. PV6]
MSDDGPGTREVAHRLFAAEFDDASLSYSESDEERAPNYVVTPTGARVNRLFVAGVLTEVERVNDETRRGRVVDPSGAFVTYAGQYQPEAQAFLERAEPPSFVALTGKARTFEPEDSDRVFTSVRPESLNEVDADTRDRSVVTAAEATLDRLAVFAKALDSDLRGEDLRAALEAGGASASLAAGIPKAIAHYDTSTAYVEAVRRLAVDALELIAGDRDEVRSPEIAPDGGGEAVIGALPETDVTIEPPSESVSEADPVSEATDPTDESASTATADDSTDSAEAESLDAEPAEAEPTGAESLDAESSEAEPPASEMSASESASTASTETDPVETTGADAGDTIETEAAADDSDPIETASDSDPAASDPAASEPAASDASAADDEGVGLGDFDAGPDDAGADSADGEPAADEPAVEESASDADEMYQLDDAEREEIESEFGTDFATGTEVDDPGEADIDVPDPEEMAEAPTEEPAGAADEGADEPVAPEADATPADEPAADEGAAADVDLEAAAVDAMGSLDDGDGADREAVVEAVVDDHGVDAEAVEDAIQDALMSGKCYEPGEGVLKPI